MYGLISWIYRKCGFWIHLEKPSPGGIAQAASKGEVDLASQCSKVWFIRYIAKILPQTRDFLVFQLSTAKRFGNIPNIPNFYHFLDLKPSLSTNNCVKTTLI